VVIAKPDADTLSTAPIAPPVAGPDRALDARPPAVALEEFGAAAVADALAFPKSAFAPRNPPTTSPTTLTPAAHLTHRGRVAYRGLLTAATAPAAPGRPSHRSGGRRADQ
jgi:hypothetical protein